MAITFKSFDNIKDFEAALGESVDVATGIPTIGGGLLEKAAGYVLAGVCLTAGARITKASEATVVGAARAASNVVRERWARMKEKQVAEDADNADNKRKKMKKGDKGDE